MHFEFMGDPADAKRRTAALSIVPTPPTPQPPKPNKPKGTADVDWIRLKQGDEGRKVTNVQALLKARGHTIVVDGIYGPSMVEHVKKFQGRNGLTVTGQVGSRTYKALLDANIE
jgi:peptidoglycan hydrolase-like protein with peptidoglycan-binding domain